MFAVNADGAGEALERVPPNASDRSPVMRYLGKRVSYAGRLDETAAPADQLWERLALPNELLGPGPRYR